MAFLINMIYFRTIGVVGVDATLDEIENFLTKNQWGTVQSFLINKQGETIFHPKLKPSTNVRNKICFSLMFIVIILLLFVYNMHFFSHF